MDTEWICFDAVTGYGKGELNHAAQILRQGGLVAFPTETVYGLGQRTHKKCLTGQIKRGRIAG